MASKPDRSVDIKVTPTLNWSDSTHFTASYAYTQTGSNSQMPPVVNPGTGEINLRSVPGNPAFSDNVLLNLNLDTTQLKDSAGNPLPGGGRWAKANEGNYPGANGAIWICATPPLNQPKNPQPIGAPRTTNGGSRGVGNSGDQLLTLMVQSDGALNGTNFNFSFCMGMALPGFKDGRFYQTIDPIVKGTGTGTNP